MSEREKERDRNRERYRENEERDRIAGTENKVRTKRRSVFGFVACILINRVDIAARNFVLPRDDNTPVPKVTTTAKTVRQIELSLFRMPIVTTVVVVSPLPENLSSALFLGMVSKHSLRK